MKALLPWLLAALMFFLLFMSQGVVKIILLALAAISTVSYLQPRWDPFGGKITAMTSGFLPSFDSSSYNLLS